MENYYYKNIVRKRKEKHKKNDQVEKKSKL